MSRSRRWFGYTQDSGQERYVELDESNAESAALGFAQSVAAGIFNDTRNMIRPTSKRPIIMRYILAQRVDADDRIVKRRFWVGSTAAPVWAEAARTAVISGETWSVTAKVGEQRFFPPATDTGIIDGDVDDNVAAGP